MVYPLTYAAFREGLAKGGLPGVRCRACGEHLFPPAAVCPHCGAADLEVCELSPRGTITTFTVIRVAREGYDAPRVIAMAELEQGPWVMGTVDGVDPDRAAMDLIGRPVAVGMGRAAPDAYSGKDVVTLAFRPVPGTPGARPRARKDGKA